MYFCRLLSYLYFYRNSLLYIIFLSNTNITQKTMLSSQVIDRETAKRIDTAGNLRRVWGIKTLQALHSCVVRNFTRSMYCSTQDIVNVNYSIFRRADNPKRYIISAIHIAMINGFDYLFTRYVNPHADAPLSAISYDDFAKNGTHYRVEHNEISKIADRLRDLSPESLFPDVIPNGAVCKAVDAWWEIHLSLPAESVTETLHHKEWTHRIDKRIKHRDNKIYREWDETVTHYPVTAKYFKVHSSLNSDLITWEDFYSSRSNPSAENHNVKRNNPHKKENKLSDFSLTKMHKDRTVSLTRLMRDIKRYSGDELPLKKVFLHVSSVDTNKYGAFIGRVDEYAVSYDDNGYFRSQIRYDCYCEDPEIDPIMYNVEDPNCSDPFICIELKQPGIVNHIKRYPSTDSVEPFWMRVDLELTPFIPKGKDKTAMFHKCSIAKVNLD